MTLCAKLNLKAHERESGRSELISVEGLEFWTRVSAFGACCKLR